MNIDQKAQIIELKQLVQLLTEQNQQLQLENEALKLKVSKLDNYKL